MLEMNELNGVRNSCQCRLYLLRPIQWQTVGNLLIPPTAKWRTRPSNNRMERVVSLNKKNVYKYFVGAGENGEKTYYCKPNGLHECCPKSPANCK